ncbi:hypothetical protein B9J07_27745 [Sinorhizobium sp. LM21]|uniref:hypothetical protein n=1 Tax=Sinorhizobium sp. LM21 TaxID=1449788 RepID=UPI0005D7E093|nr:hypothetical protein [Sinorhizobium sp. LM21]AJW30213.1 hypothetical protein pLM21S1_p93 [Sinorhizobium sp. LM21]OWZ90383.1 hypothetical protein B9J07_27745 [Sinorhizobium sp. LM21]
MVNGHKPMSPDEELFTVTTTVIVYAKDRKHAAMKAFALHDTLTPESYEVANAASMWRNVELGEEDVDEARRAYRAGEYFPEVNLSDLPK